MEKAYPTIYFDALVVKVRHDKQIINKAIYLALAVTLEGNKEWLGMWCSQNEGSKFWLGILTELKTPRHYGQLRRRVVTRHPDSWNILLSAS